MRINITVKPNSTKGPLLEEQPDKSLIIYLREIAFDGQANQALIKLLAKHFKASKNNISIIRGKTSRHKVVDIIEIN